MQGPAPERQGLVNKRQLSPFLPSLSAETLRSITGPLPRSWPARRTPSQHWGALTPPLLHSRAPSLLRPPWSLCRSRDGRWLTLWLRQTERTPSARGGPVGWSPCPQRLPPVNAKSLQRPRKRREVRPPATGPALSPSPTRSDHPAPASRPLGTARPEALSRVQPLARAPCHSHSGGSLGGRPLPDLPVRPGRLPGVPPGAVCPKCPSSPPDPQWCHCLSVCLLAPPHPRREREWDRGLDLLLCPSLCATQHLAGRGHPVGV